MPYAFLVYLLFVECGWCGSVNDDPSMSQSNNDIHCVQKAIALREREREKERKKERYINVF